MQEQLHQRLKLVAYLVDGKYDEERDPVRSLRAYQATKALAPRNRIVRTLVPMD